MENQIHHARQYTFHSLKLAKKQQITKNTFTLSFEIPADLRKNFQFEAGQYVGLKYYHHGELYIKDFSMTNAPHEEGIVLGIKINSEESSVRELFEQYSEGDFIEVSEPKGRFTIVSKPHEFRTIVGFAAGIGITPLLSHFKHILHTEPRTRLFLFYGNKDRESVAFKDVLDDLQKQHSERLEIHYFYSREKIGDRLSEGRLDEKKLHLIINQILHLDDTDEESTVWDAVDEVLICGKGPMIKSIANACHQHGILKNNIHFELFEEYNEDIYPVEVEFPLVENIRVSFRYNGEQYETVLENNKNKLLQSLSILKFPVPFSCKSGICGSCECRLQEGKVELLENEYLTENEEQKGNILACMSYALTDTIRLDFDNV